MGHVDTDCVRPRDPVELWLAERWRELLGFPVGIRDDFFGLGGNSLDTARLANAVLARFDVQLPVNMVTENPTVALLAARLRERNVSLADPLVEIQAGDGGHPPLFLVHPANGQVGPYHDLARALGEEFTVHALQPIGLYSDAEPLTTVPDMAHRYVETLRSVQPAGPYRLGGCSTGALVALEMARQLVHAGERVSLVADIDLALLEPLLAEHEPGGRDTELTLPVVDGWRAAGLLPDDEDARFAERTVRVWRANRAAARAHRPGRYQGVTHAFRSPAGRPSAPPAGPMVHVHRAGTADEVADLVREGRLLSDAPPDC